MSYIFTDLSDEHVNKFLSWTFMASTALLWGWNDLNWADSEDSERKRERKKERERERERGEKRKGTINLKGRHKIHKTATSHKNFPQH